MSKQQIIKILFSQDIQKISSLLTNNKNIDLPKYRLKNNTSILHYYSYKGKKDIIELCLDYATKFLKLKKQSEEEPEIHVKQQIGMWIDLKNDEEVTAIMHASVNGFVDILELLVARGGNFTIKNKNGQGPLHLAAQQNMVSTFIFFQGQLDLNEQDNNGVTPLHWASFHGNEEVVAYILSLPDIDLQLKDKQSQSTPLLLATQNGNTKIVRRLLMKGAQRSARNSDNKKALQIAQENEFINIAKMLDSKKTCCTCVQFYYNVKVRYEPTTRSLKMPIVYILTTALAITILNILMQFHYDYLSIVEGVLFGLMLLLYLSLLRAPKIGNKSRLPYYNTQKLCFQCCQQIPNRGYHCDTCGICIEQYDHHCTWINNCVGKRNIARFLIFVTLLVFSLAALGTAAAYGIFCLMTDYDSQVFHWRIHTDVDWQKYLALCLLIINCGVSMFIFPILMLLVVQIRNILTNTTTYQQARGQTKQASLKNCKLMCCHSSLRKSLLGNSEFSQEAQTFSKQ